MTKEDLTDIQTLYSLRMQFNLAIDRNARAAKRGRLRQEDALLSEKLLQEEYEHFYKIYEGPEEKHSGDMGGFDYMWGLPTQYRVRK